MKVRIEATGAPGDTRVVDADTGQTIPGVYAASWVQPSPHDHPVVTLQLNALAFAHVAGEARWAGLDIVPTEALRAELDRRDHEGRL